ncbi:MAG: cob(I)yrinic acid a,c-diamide adenosyltransferase [Gammaproteobacteria bacterium]
MGNRLSKIYTRTGDDGSTGLGDGSRIAKSAPRVALMGDIDELNCIIGVLLTADMDESIHERLIDIQHGLFNLGGETSIPDYRMLTAASVKQLETYIDEYNRELPPLKEFILPGGNPAAARCHLARAVCRRAERTMVRLAETESVNEQGRVYLNRLSDLLFVLARLFSRRDGGSEIYWEKDRV